MVKVIEKHLRKTIDIARQAWNVGEHDKALGMLVSVKRLARLACKRGMINKHQQSYLIDRVNGCICWSF